MHSATTSSIDFLDLVLLKIGSMVFSVEKHSFDRIVFNPKIYSLPDAKSCISGITVEENSVRPIIDAHQFMCDKSMMKKTSADAKYCIVVNSGDLHYGVLASKIYGMANIGADEIKYSNIAQTCYSPIVQNIRGYWETRDKIQIAILSLNAIFKDIINGD